MAAVQKICVPMPGENKLLGVALRVIVGGGVGVAVGVGTDVGVGPPVGPLAQFVPGVEFASNAPMSYRLPPGRF